MKISVSRFENATLCLVNLERTDRGLTALQSQSQLGDAALEHSMQMSQMGYFAHDSADGSPFVDLIFASGYLQHANVWIAGQNIAWGTRSSGSPRSIATAWMNSPTHRAVILEPGYRELGVGAIRGSPINPHARNAVIVTQDFASVSG